MLLNTDNNKAAERQVVSEVVNKFWENPTSANRENVRDALEAYYDAFLAEQDEIVRLTEEAREERITASFAYYTSDLFQQKLGFWREPQNKPQDNLKGQKILIKIRKTPDFMLKSGAFMVAEAGLEPTTSGL